MTMSNAASTIPGKPNLYHNNKSKSKEDVKNLQNGKAAQNNPTDVNKEEINPKLVHKTKQHGANGKNTTPKVNANGKSWMEKNSSKLSNEAKPSKNMKPDFRWMPKPLASDPNQIKILSIPEYQAMTKEIETLRERCFNDGGKISELEKQQSKLLGEFDALYEENAMLRKKLDTGNEPIAEPYGRVFEDRKILRESELGYKKRINRLEQEHKEARKEVEKLTNELKAIRAKQSGKAETPGKESIIYHLNTQIQKLRNDNQKLSAQVKKYAEQHKPLSSSSSHTDQIMKPTKKQREGKTGILKVTEVQNHVNNNVQKNNTAMMSNALPKTDHTVKLKQEQHPNHTAIKSNASPKTEHTEKNKEEKYPPARGKPPPFRKRIEIKKQTEKDVSPYATAQFGTFYPGRETHFDYEYLLPDSDLQDF